MTANEQTPKNGELLFSEAPASWNTRYVDPQGFECQLTLRAEKGLELLEKASSAISYLLNNGCIPYIYSRGNGHSGTRKENQHAGGNGSSNNGGTDNSGWCPIHQCEMKRWDKNGKVWYSHKVDGGWCQGKSS